MGFQLAPQASGADKPLVSGGVEGKPNGGTSCTNTATTPGPVWTPGGSGVTTMVDWFAADFGDRVHESETGSWLDDRHAEGVDE